MSGGDDTHRERIRAAAASLRQAERPVRILQSIAWPLAAKEAFFAGGAREMPRVSYPAFDPAPTLAALAEAQRHAPHTPPVVRSWLLRQIDAIERGARMLAAAGTPEFHHHSRRLFGAPTDPQPDEDSSALDLARQLTDVLATLAHVDVGAPDEACHRAETVAERMQAAVDQAFGARAPAVELVDDLSANALAGPRRIRIRRGASFTDKDVDQLVQHEAFIHVATSLNGRAQADVPILASGHPGTTRTQEGLAVFAEFITGAIELDRLRRLADRVLAIQMAMDGADFLQVYRFFLERTGEAEQAYENARRVFRGGVLGGGAPFTKDVVYLDGLLRVHNFLSSVVSAGRSDCLRLLFCGKLDIEDIPALCELSRLGLCRAPLFLPPWARDLRYLLSYLAYSSFLNRMKLETVRRHYVALLADAPRVDPGAPV